MVENKLLNFPNSDWIDWIDISNANFRSILFLSFRRLLSIIFKESNNTFSNGIEEISFCFIKSKEEIVEYFSTVIISLLSFFFITSFQYAILSNMHAKEVIEINNNGHITMPPDLKRSNKKTYNEDNNHNPNKGKLIGLIIT